METLLIKRLLNKDVSALDDLLNLYQEKVYNLCLGMMGNVEDAEELTQDTFIDVFNKISKFKGQSQLYTWIYRIATNKCLEHIRNSKRQKRSGVKVNIEGREKMIESNFDHPGYDLEQKERAEILHRYLKELPEKQHEALVLYEFQGLNYEELAKAMDTTKSAIESLLFRARKNLKALLTEHYTINEL